MKFFAVFAAIVAVAIARPSPSSSAVTYGSDLTLNELSELLQNPLINPAAVPYLEQALNIIMEALFAGGDMHSVHFALPADVPLYAEPQIVSPSPVVVGPIAPGTSPLVQIVINVNNEQQVADVITPTPVLPEIVPEPIQVVEEADNTVDPIQVLPLPNPDVNPIDVIAVNPVDTWGPSGLAPAIDAEDVGPL